MQTTHCRDWAEAAWAARVEEMKSGGLTSQRLARKGVGGIGLAAMGGGGRVVNGWQASDGAWNVRRAETARGPRAAGEEGQQQRRQMGLHRQCSDGDEGRAAGIPISPAQGGRQASCLLGPKFPGGLLEEQLGGLGRDGSRI